MVLVVEDHPATREVVAALIRRRGHDARIAPSGHAALNFLSVLRPDMVVLDLCMPDMNGMEVLRAIREQPALRGVAVVIFTAHEDQTDEALAGGAQACIIKGRTSWISFLEQLEGYLS